MQIELLAFQNDVQAHPVEVAFIGDSVSAIADLLSQGANIEIFENFYTDETTGEKHWSHWDESMEWVWDESMDDWVFVNKYYLMVLIDRKYWAFYPSYIKAQQLVPEPYSGSSVLSFEEMEAIENQLLARAG
jgi:hypothetical protein